MSISAFIYLNLARLALSPLGYKVTNTYSIKILLPSLGKKKINAFAIVNLLAHPKLGDCQLSFIKFIPVKIKVSVAHN